MPRYGYEQPVTVRSFDCTNKALRNGPIYQLSGPGAQQPTCWQVCWSACGKPRESTGFSSLLSLDSACWSLIQFQLPFHAGETSTGRGGNYYKWRNRPSFDRPALEKDFKSRRTAFTRELPSFAWPPNRNL